MATSVPPANLPSPAPVATQEGTKTSDHVAASHPSPGARQPQVVPGEAAREEGLVAARFLPSGTAGDTAAPQHARGRDRRLSSE